MTNLKPCYALTIGDPTGIGAEITAKLLHELGKTAEAMPYKLNVIGHIGQLQSTAESLSVSLPTTHIIYTHIDADPLTQAGKIAFQAVELAVELTHSGQTQGIVTGPISKQNLWDAGYNASGHTEILEASARRLWQDETLQADMIFLFEQFRLLLLTRHVPLMQVPETLKKPSSLASLESFIQFLRGAEKLDCPRLALMGVNPHAGEIGGEEEATILQPLIEAINTQGLAILSAPQPADALFRGFNPLKPAFDAYVATYHDQGLIPMKLVGGFSAVNITIGLPFLRTSVSHGVATDIVGQNMASPSSLQHALETLHRLIVF
ncbi:MAG: 4-hydroxythreonine-4-phosphate dehydrogenase PdxA [Candidatus Melainabacteria bacterium]|nr:4-hydroxythreonine-4-phosphate dehydrogenase PdxA [Candidatus Melainabacteria bacterium]